MRILNTIMSILVFLSLTSFNFFKPKAPDYADIAREIRAEVSKKLSKKHQMDCIGIRGGMMGSVNMLGMSFQIYHPMDENEARALIVDCVEELIQAVNENEEIRPFLKNYPFTNKNIEIIIFSSEPDGRDVYDPIIAVVGVYARDDVTYSTREPNLLGYKKRYREPYQEALQKLKKGNVVQKPSPGLLSCI